ncbi:MAG: hypothetical protein GX058_09030 [Firmicutes bacterium]|nr:hypothetical protein [Bacillota bacterium]
MQGGDQIIAAVVTKESRERLAGDILVLVAENTAEVQAIATSLARITNSMIHELPTGIILLVKH